MKKIQILLLTFLFALFLVFQTGEIAHAQDLDDSDLVTNPGDITFGLGLTNGSSVGLLENSEIGLTGQFYFTITDEFRAGADFTYYLIGERQLNANELNANVHYFLRNRNRLAFYGLAGINMSTTSGSDQKWRVEREVGSPDTRRFGLNIGAGIDLRFNNISVFAEPKLSLLSWNQFAFTGGVRYIL